MAASEMGELKSLCWNQAAQLGHMCPHGQRDSATGLLELEPVARKASLRADGWGRISYGCANQ